MGCSRHRPNVHHIKVKVQDVLLLVSRTELFLSRNYQRKIQRIGQKSFAKLLQYSDFSSEQNISTVSHTSHFHDAKALNSSHTEEQRVVSVVLAAHRACYRQLLSAPDWNASDDTGSKLPDSQLPRHPTHHVNDQHLCREHSSLVLLPSAAFPKPWKRDTIDDILFACAFACACLRAHQPTYHREEAASVIVEQGENELGSLLQRPLDKVGHAEEKLANRAHGRTSRCGEVRRCSKSQVIDALAVEEGTIWALLFRSGMIYSVFSSIGWSAQSQLTLFPHVQGQPSRPRVGSMYDNSAHFYCVRPS